MREDVSKDVVVSRRVRGAANAVNNGFVEDLVCDVEVRKLP